MTHKRHIALVCCAHVDAGKTTFSEQLLFHGGRLRRAGSVDDRTTSLDHHAIEKQRGITVFSEQSGFELGEDTFYLLDTPGHVDFSTAMERSIQIADCALLLVSAVEGVQGHTKTVWKLLQAYHIPAFFFINKLDRAGADEKRVREQLAELTDLPQIDGIRISEPDEDFMEQLATADEGLMDAFFAGEGNPAFWQAAGKRLFAEEKLTPVFAGSALHDAGVAEFMGALPFWASEKEHDEEAPFSARVSRLTRDSSGQRWYHIRVLSGRLAVRDSIKTPQGIQKVGEIRSCYGGRLVPVRQLSAGEIAAVSGISAEVGGLLGENEGNAGYLPRLIPLMKSAVCFPKELPVSQILADFKQLAEEEPSLQTEYSEQTGEISVCTMGEIQLEILSALAEERFGCPVSFGGCRPVYRETIAAAVSGNGHYEPLRHYAEVHLRLEPGERGSGISYASECSLEILNQDDQNLILTMLRESEKLGVLTGAPLTDVKIILTAGATHLKHTEGGDLKEAACRALRQGLMKAENILLAPWCRFEISVPVSLSGRVITDMGQLSARTEPPVLDESGENLTLSGRAPAAGLFSYPKQLASLSGGQGSIRFFFDGYEPCKKAEQEQACREAGYHPASDTEHSPDSIFCAHGAGFLVHWDEADGYMHVK